MTQILETVKTLPNYTPGKSLTQPNSIKLSSNENPYPPIPEVIAKASETLHEQNRYPQMYGENLVAALAETHHCQPDNIVVGNGSVALLNHALTTVAGAGDKIVSPWRSFEAYPIIIGTTQAQMIKIPLDTQTHSINLHAVSQAVQNHNNVRAVLLCSPNNPTGTTLKHHEVHDFMQTIPPQIMVILDEAYIEFVTDKNAVNGLHLLNQFPNLITARTFSKAYQLAGLRVGYLIGADTELMKSIRKVSTPFGVNSVGSAAALEALHHREKTKKQVNEIITQRQLTVNTLRKDGWEIPQTQGNFYWIAGANLVTPITKTLTEHGITARPFPEGVRISIGLPEENNRVITALHQIKAKP